MLSLAQEPDRRIWVILDELPTLHQVPSLQPGLAESRQFGGCFVLGVQVASALRDLYGRNGAETISGLCGTRVVLAAPDRDTAQWSADSLGRSEVEEVTEGYSYGANTIRDGVSLTPRRELRALALPSEIMRLENLSGYLKFPGPFPVASVRLKYVSRPKASERFVPREGDGAESPDRAVDADVAASPPAVEPAGDGDIAIPALPGEAGAVLGKPSPAPDDEPEHGLLQGELPLLPASGKAVEGQAGAEEPAGGAGTAEAPASGDAGPEDETGHGPKPPASTAPDAPPCAAAEGGKEPAARPDAGPPATDRPDWG